MREVLKRLKLAIPIGLIYGILLYMLVWAGQHVDEGLPAIAGLVLFPTGVGSVVAAFYDPRAERRVLDSIFASWGVFFGILSITALFFGEGIVCIIMAIPIALPTLALGAYLTHAWVRNRGKRNLTPCIAVLPLLVLPVENMITWPNQITHVTSVVEIDAPADVVWRNTVDIPDIDPDQLGWTVSHSLMFIPKPLDARMQGSGVGAARELSWTRGVSFRERITEWEQDRRLSWGFEFDADSIPRGIDDHIRPDSDYLELVRGEYELTPLPSGGTQLSLTTWYRVQTPINGYLNLWGHMFLNDFHGIVLAEIDRRATAEAGAS
ncbi:hypothetical protein JJJ17_07340 [Paracoccus caeni]|uniref:Polyketide cyclase / dehydrase and lipid transport n=1 Tax=Paracoccus caeni TaxID=657651 RepID=A0A934SIF0_9RHOB|nr:hypothetical protein [Paracoccus caeni]MBK4215734.1 hypothetical protein [Paracoccus caeni]